MWKPYREITDYEIREFKRQSSKKALVVPGTPYLIAWANSGKSGRARREQACGDRYGHRLMAMRLMAIRQARRSHWR